MKKLLFGIFFTISTSSISALAEDIKIPIGTQMPESEQIARPKTGASKSEVKGFFGNPLKESAPKGNPPISHWEYEEFTVYFEGDRAIHSVIKPRFHGNTELHNSKDDAIESVGDKSSNDPKPQ